MKAEEAGFTVIEALVALVLGAMVLAAVLSTVRIAAQSAARAQAATADAESFGRADAILTGDLAHALWLTDAAGRAVFLGAADQVDLPQTARPLQPQVLPRPPVAVVYHIASVGQRAVLTRAEAPLIDAQFQPPGPATVLWTAAGALEFRYLDASGAWLRGWTDGASLPRAIAVADPGDGVPKLVAALPDLLPAACVAGPGPDCPLAEGAFP